jgi:hypothetical protein
MTYVSRRRKRLLRAAIVRNVGRGAARKNWYQRNESRLKFVLASIGLLVGVNEYLQRQHDSRVQRSLDIYERFQSSTVLEARLGIDQLWNNPEFWGLIGERRNEAIEAEEQFSWEYMSELALDAVKSRQIVDDLFVVWAISSEASLCLSRGQCDQATICQSFWHDTQKYYYFFEPYFEARAIAWDETIQNREWISNEILEDYCGNSTYRALYIVSDPIPEDDAINGAWTWLNDTMFSVRRYFHESFNIPVGL